MNLREIDLREIYKVWKSNLRGFRCFFRSTPFVSLQTYDDFTLEDYKNEVNKDTLKIILDEYKEDYFVIVDLPLNEILDLALEVNNNYDIKPILNVNLLFHPFGMVGDTKNISKLINNGLKLKKQKSEKYIMFISYDRYDEKIDVTKVYDKLNNQYAIGGDDMPGSEDLKQAGYKGVVVITKDNVKEDLRDYINSINNEIEVKLVKVDK